MLFRSWLPRYSRSPVWLIVTYARNTFHTDTLRICGHWIALIVFSCKISSSIMATGLPWLPLYLQLRRPRVIVIARGRVLRLTDLLSFQRLWFFKHTCVCVCVCVCVHTKETFEINQSGKAVVSANKIATPHQRRTENQKTRKIFEEKKKFAERRREKRLDVREGNSFNETSLSDGGSPLGEPSRWPNPLRLLIGSRR